MFKKKQLTERQRDILESVGLPTEWDRLRKIQQMEIVETEKKLRHLERKYNKRFCYKKSDDYDKLRGFGELIVYAEGDDPKTESFLIEDKRGTFSFGYDDYYDWVLALKEARKEVEAEVSNLIHDQKYKVYTTLLGVRRKKATSIDVEIAIENTNEEYCDKLFESIYSKLKGNQRIRYIAMWCLNKGVISELDETHFSLSANDEKIRIWYGGFVNSENLESTYRKEVSN